MKQATDVEVISIEVAFTCPHCNVPVEGEVDVEEIGCEVELVCYCCKEKCLVKVPE